MIDPPKPRETSPLRCLTWLLWAALVPAGGAASAALALGLAERAREHVTLHLHAAAREHTPQLRRERQCRVMRGAAAGLPGWQAGATAAAAGGPVQQLDLEPLDHAVECRVDLVERVR